MQVSAFAQAQPSAFKLVKLGRYDEARAKLAVTPHRKYHEFYLEGLIAKREGDFALAEKNFRDALSVNPKFASARKHLAHTLFLAENYDGAKHHFQALADTTDNEIERQGFNQFLSAIRAKRPYGFSGFFGFLPSTNFNKGSDNPDTGVLFTSGGQQVGTLNEDSQSQSGIGFTAGLSGFLRHDLPDNKLLLFSGSIGANLYEQDQFNSANGVLTAEFGARHDSGNIFVGATLHYSISDFSTDEDISDFERSTTRYGPNVRGVHTVNEKNLISYNFSALRQRFSSFEARNGYFYSSFVNWRHAFDRSQSLNLGFGIAGEDTERDDQTYIAYRFNSAFTKEWKGGLSTTISAGYERRNYDDFFTLIPVVREDDRYNIGISLLHPKLAFKGFAPKFSYKYSVQDSSISFLEHDSHDFGLVWTKKF